MQHTDTETTKTEATTSPAQALVPVTPSAAPIGTVKADSGVDSVEKPPKKAVKPAEKARSKKAPKKPAQAASGKKPSKIKRDQFGFVTGKKTAQAAAMYVGKGATTEQIRKKLGAPHLNLLAKVKADGHKVLVKKVKGPNNREVTHYTIVVNEKKVHKTT